MDAEFAKRWVARLRDQNLKQTQDRLFDGTGYCCLGVAEIEAGNKMVWDDEGGDDCDGAFIVSTSDNTWDALTDRTREKCDFFSRDGGRRDRTPIRIGGVDYVNLADANDKGRTFKEIADYVEANYEML